jgi:hypothetical protein
MYMLIIFMLTITNKIRNDTIISEHACRIVLERVNDVFHQSPLLEAVAIRVLGTGIL